jgi:hypothetical protein
MLAIIYNGFNFFSPKNAHVRNNQKSVYIQEQTISCHTKKATFSNINNSKRNLYDFQFIENECRYKTFNLGDMICDIVSLSSRQNRVYNRGEKKFFLRFLSILNICYFFQNANQ